MILVTSKSREDENTGAKTGGLANFSFRVRHKKKKTKKMEIRSCAIYVLQFL